MGDFASSSMRRLIAHSESCLKTFLMHNLASIWRSLVPVVRQKPLGICDWSSVRSPDWELCDQVMDDRVDEAMYLVHKPEHKWWWLPEQSHKELTIFVVWDSEKFKNGQQG